MPYLMHETASPCMQRQGIIPQGSPYAYQETFEFQCAEKDAFQTVSGDPGFSSLTLIGNNPLMLKKTDPVNMISRCTDRPPEKMEIGPFMLKKHDPGKTISRRTHTDKDKSLKKPNGCLKKSAIARAMTRRSSGSIILSMRG